MKFRAVGTPHSCDVRHITLTLSTGVCIQLHLVCNQCPDDRVSTKKGTSYLCMQAPPIFPSKSCLFSFQKPAWYIYKYMCLLTCMTSEKHPCPLALRWIRILLSYDWLPNILAWTNTVAVDLECFWCDEITANAKKAMLIIFLFLHFAVITVALRGCGYQQKVNFPFDIGRTKRHYNLFGLEI